MPNTVHIIDYGMGNLRSVQKGFEKVGASAVICHTPGKAAEAESSCFREFGAFRDAIAELKRHDFVGLINDHIAATNRSSASASGCSSSLTSATKMANTKAWEFLPARSFGSRLCPG